VLTSSSGMSGTSTTQHYYLSPRNITMLPRATLPTMVLYLSLHGADCCPCFACTACTTARAAAPRPHTTAHTPTATPGHYFSFGRGNRRRRRAATGI